MLAMKDDQILRQNVAHLVDVVGVATRAEIAAAAKVSEQAIGQLIRGESKSLKPLNLVRIARRLSVPVDDLVEKPLWTKGALQGGKSPTTLNSMRDVLAIPLLNQGGSMGAGAYLEEHVDVVRQIAVSVQQLRREVSFTSPINLRFITGYGDSMQPTFFDGDTLLVDVGITEIKIDAVYVLELNGELYIKRLQRRPDGNLLMISDNKAYEPYVIQGPEIDRFEIRGRVLLAWNRRKL